jgi:hypothetical protein
LKILTRIESKTIVAESRGNDSRFTFSSAMYTSMKVLTISGFDSTWSGLVGLPQENITVITTGKSHFKPLNSVSDFILLIQSILQFGWGKIIIIVLFLGLARGHTLTGINLLDTNILPVENVG